MTNTPRITSDRRAPRDNSTSWGGESGWEGEVVDAQYVTVANGTITADRIRGPTEGLVAQWTFEDPTTPDAIDTVGTNDGAIDGATYAGAGRVGANSLLVDPGSRGSVTFTSSELDIQGSFTIAAYARMDGSALEGWQRIYQKGRGKDDRTVELYVADNNNKSTGLTGFRVNEETPSKATRIHHERPGFSFGTYYHYTAVYDAVNEYLRVYIDGTLLDSVTHTDGIDSNTRHTIGNWATNGSRPWNGGIDDVRIYNRALPRADVESLYSAVR
ncbi:MULTISPECIES: LamG domain-containing protein [Haloferacaceae]|uniref:LamG domain-containing protein n=2 Tax=Haloferacaceae TaxID=1644056 RepID=A0ABD6DAC2_9EURY|nr:MULTISPECIES: LamG domain-containing protein [Halorubraceae]